MKTKSKPEVIALFNTVMSLREMYDLSDRDVLMSICIVEQMMEQYLQVKL